MKLAVPVNEATVYSSVWPCKPGNNNNKRCSVVMPMVVIVTGPNPFSVTFGTSKENVVEPKSTTLRRVTVTIVPISETTVRISFSKNNGLVSVLIKEWP